MTDELEESFRHLFSRRLGLYHSASLTSQNAAGVEIVLNKTGIRTDSGTHRTIIGGRAILTEIPWQISGALWIAAVSRLLLILLILRR